MRIVTAAAPAGCAAAIAVIALAGCSSPPATTAPTTTPAAITAATAAPASAPPAATPVASLPPAPAASATASPPPASQPGLLTATITVLDTRSGLVPGGFPVPFTVTVTNRSAQTYGSILPLVSLSHCGCTASSLFPAGILQERESTSNVWQTIPYDVEGFGTDYLSADEPGGIQLLGPGGTVTFEYRVALNAATSAQVTAGPASIDVTLEQIPGHTVLGSAPAASAPVEVLSGRPPA
jgi:hypothetical protein